MPAVEVAELGPWEEDGERRRGLRARFPGSIAGHSTDQELYFGGDGLLRRHDCRVDVAGGFPAAQYAENAIEADGLRFPARRRAYMREPDGAVLRDRVMVSIDLGDLRLS